MRLWSRGLLTPGIDEQFEEEWDRQPEEERLHGNGVVDSVVLLVDLNEMQGKVFWKIGTLILFWPASAFRL